MSRHRENVGLTFWEKVRDRLPAVQGLPLPFTLVLGTEHLSAEWEESSPSTNDRGMKVEQYQEELESWFQLRNIPTTLGEDVGSEVDLLLLDLLGDLCELIELDFFTVSFPEEDDGDRFVGGTRSAVEQTVTEAQEKPFLGWKQKNSCTAEYVWFAVSKDQE